jgi:hypothetical protein
MIYPYSPAVTTTTNVPDPLPLVPLKINKPTYPYVSTLSERVFLCYFYLFFFFSI